MQAKIATCCYCGTRAALVLSEDRHELVCSSCGAPLHDLKRLRSDKHGDRELVGTSVTKKHRGDGSPNKKKKQKKLSFKERLLREVWDKADDIFDDLF